MKTSLLCSTVIAASLGFTFGAFGAGPMTIAPEWSGGRAIRAKLLQITVSMAASMHPRLSEDIAEVFAEQVADTLHQRGFEDPIHYVAAVDDPATDQALLAITLVAWQQDPHGNVTCTFSTALQTPERKSELGIFTGVATGMNPRPAWFLLEDRFEDASRQAASELVSRLLDSHLLSP